MLLAVVGRLPGHATVAGYDRASSSPRSSGSGRACSPWSALWAWTDLADRIRTGDVVADLLRPVDPVTSYLATDLGPGRARAC